jgi:hypothetical protein
LGGAPTTQPLWFRVEYLNQRLKFDIDKDTERDKLGMINQQLGQERRVPNLQSLNLKKGGEG